MSPRFKSWQPHQPSPQVRALSAASRERSLAAWAALGPHPHPRRQAYRPFRAVHPGSRRHDHHPPWSPAQPRTTATQQGCGNSRCSLLPCHSAAASHGRSARRPGLPGRAAGTRGRRPPTTRPGSPPDTPTDRRASSAASPASSPARPSTKPLNGTVGCPPYRPWSPTPPPDVGQTDVAGRTGADTRRLDTGRWTPDGWTLHEWTADGRTAGPRTAEPDGWTPHAGRGPETDAVAGVLASSTTATVPDRWMPAGGSAGQTRLGEQPPRTAQQQALRGHRAPTDGA
jgi:hypothetical protein